MRPRERSFQALGERQLPQERARLPGLVSTSHLHPDLGQQPADTTNGRLPTMVPDPARAITAAAGPRPALTRSRWLGALNDVATDTTAPSAHRD